MSPSDSGPFDPLNKYSREYSEFEQRLRERVFAVGPSTERRDRVLYDSGYAAAMQACDAVASGCDHVTRRTLARWRALALGLAALWGLSVGLPLWQTADARRPSADVLEQKSVPEHTGPSGGATQATIWPGMLPDLAQVTPPAVLSPRITSIRSRWTDGEAVPRPWPTTEDFHPGQAVMPPLRASDARRILESI